jgi:hypothetical protein
VTSSVRSPDRVVLAYELVQAAVLEPDGPAIADANAL